MGLGVRQIYFIQNNNLGFFSQALAKKGQLLINLVKLGQWVRGSAIEQMDEQAAALDVAQKLMAQPGAGVGALDQARNIGQHQVTMVQHHHAQIGLQGGKGIISDFRPGLADYRQQGAFPGVGHPDQPDIGN